MEDKKFVQAVDRNGRKAFVPAHYLNNPKWGFKPRHRTKVQEPATPDATGTATTTVTEPAKRATKKEVAE